MAGFDPNFTIVPEFVLNSAALPATTLLVVGSAAAGGIRYRQSG